MKITDSLIKIRKSKQLSQTYIAELLQTTQQQYSKYETGMQEIPVRHIIKLCDFYEITANELLGITTYMTREEGSAKFQELHRRVEDILYWATGQNYINEEQRDLLLHNIETAKTDIENQ